MTPTDLLKIVGEVLDRFGCAVERSESVAMIPICPRHYLRAEGSGTQVSVWSGRSTPSSRDIDRSLAKSTDASD